MLDSEKRKGWDTADFYDVITTIDEETDVCHVGVPSYGPINPRDFVSVRRSIIDKVADTYTAVQVSIDYPITGREQMVKKHVRGKLLPSCWRFEQKEGGCMTYYICTSLSPSIACPSALLSVNCHSNQNFLNFALVDFFLIGCTFCCIELFAQFLIGCFDHFLGQLACNLAVGSPRLSLTPLSTVTPTMPSSPMLESAF